MLLPSKAQIILFWGPEFTVFYNDAYRPVFGAKHPHALGLPGREAWSEIWDSVLHELLAGVVRTGEAFWGKDLLFELERHGFLEETYFDVSYDPGARRVGRGRRRVLHRDRNDRARGRRAAHGAAEGTGRAQCRGADTRDACVLATETLAAKPQDVTFALAYLDGELQSCTPQAEERLARRPARPRQGAPVVSSSARRRPAGSSSASIRGGRSTTSTARSSNSSPTSSAPRWRTPARTRRSGARRSARGARSREDGVFQQRQPRVPDAAHAACSGRPRTPSASPERALAGDALEIVHRNELRLLKLVNTLLDFSRIEAGRSDAAYVPTDLRSSPPMSPARFDRRSNAPACDFAVDCPPLLAAGLRGSRDVGEDRPQSALERAEVHVRRVGPPVAP